jgi:DNA-directed RNA polymerase subunit N (RpoN/RPB10)
VRELGEVLEEQLGVDEEAGLDEVEVLDDLGVAAPQQDSCRRRPAG